MQKKKGTQISDPKKDQNIQSKLLGTDVSEINIEKFRQEKYEKPKYNLNGKLNEDILRTISGKFTTDVIFMLDLSNQSLMNIDALEKCTNLMMLNLKQNQIKDIYCLRECVSLVYLNVANNRIMFCEPLKGIQKLANLHLEDNQIKNGKSLRGLELCAGLRTLYLKTLSGNDANEICQEKDYRNFIFQTIPALQRLDGIPKNTDLDNGEFLVNADFSGSGVYFTKAYPKIEIPKDIKLDGEDQLKASLKETKSMISKLEAKMKALMC